MESPSKLYATVLGLVAFAIAVIAGLAGGADAASVLTRAMVSMIVCYGLGAVLGMIAGTAIDEFIAEYQAKNRPVSLEEAAAMYDLPEVSEE